MIDSKFKVIRELGQGGSSKVFLAKDDMNNQFAVKILRKDKKYTYTKGSLMLKKEHWIMNKLSSHPNILNSLMTNPDGFLKSGSKSDKIQYNILELAENGPISKYIRITGSIEEDLVRFMFLQLTDALRYIHSNNFAHLDLKLENILLDKYYNIRLADLGVAYELSNKSWKCKLRRGTLHYMAPEVMNLRKGTEFDAYKADIYSLGVCLYILLIGEFPDQNILKRNYLSTEGSDNDVVMDWEIIEDKQSTKKWDCLSESVKNLLLQVLSPNPELRPSIDDILAHPWLWEIDFEEVQSNLYSEMVHRKKFISSFPIRKTRT